MTFARWSKPLTLLAMCLVLFSLASLLCGLAPTFPLLVIGRVLQGVGAALELPGTLSIFSITYPDPKERARAISIWASVAGLALAIGPTAGAFLVDTFGWQSIFFLNLPIGLLTLAIALSIVAESSHAQGQRIDLPGQLLVILFLVSLTYAVIESRAWSWNSPLMLGCLALALACLVVFVLVEQHTSRPMVPLDIFRQRALSSALAIASMMTFGMYGMFFLISLYLQQIKQNSPLLAGLQLLPLSITFILLSPVAGRLMNRYGPRWLMAAGMALMGCGLLLFTLLIPETSYGFLIVTMALIGIGLGFNTGPVMAVAVGSVSSTRAGLASGFGNVARMIGATLGVAVLGAILASHLASGHSVIAFITGLHTAFLVGGCIELLGSVLAVLYIPQTMIKASPTTSEQPAPVSSRSYSDGR